MIDRRAFLAGGAAAMLAVRNAHSADRLPIRKALYMSMLGKEGSVKDRFQIARDAGFEAIECPTTEAQADAEEIKKAAESTGLKIHSVMNQAHWKYPLSSSDP